MELRAFLVGCRRVLLVSKKPSRKELDLSVKVSALGLLVVGGIAFIIRFISAMMQGFTAP